MDYLGLGQRPEKAVDNYTRSGGKGKAAFDKADAVAVMLEKHEVCCTMFHRFDWSVWTTGTPADRLTIIPAAQDHILELEEEEHSNDKGQNGSRGRTKKDRYLRP